jgi:hypothetical protein
MAYMLSVQLYGRRATNWTVGVIFPAGVRDLTAPHSVQAGYPIQWESRALFPRGKAAGASHSPRCNAKVKNYAGIPPLPIRFHDVLLNY